MANELQISFNASLVNGNFTDNIPSSTVQITQAAVGAWRPIVIVGTAEEDMAVVDISTLGWLYLKNLDTTNYVQWGPKSGGVMVPFGRIKPGEIAHLRLEPGITLRWIANTAAVKIEVRLYEN